MNLEEKVLELIKEIDRTYEDYVDTEGCTCCESYPDHNDYNNKLKDLIYELKGLVDD